MLARLAALVFAVTPATAFAEDDPAKLYDLTVTATPKVKAGEGGRVELKIVPKAGAEIHKEAPISLSLATKGVVAPKAKVGREELVMKGADAAFDVPFKADAPGAAQIEATLKFYICTEKMCAAQERKATLPVLVEPR